MQKHQFVPSNFHSQLCTHCTLRASNEIHDVARRVNGVPVCTPVCPICSGNGVNCCATARSVAKEVAKEFTPAAHFTVHDLALIRRVILEVIDTTEHHFYEDADDGHYITEEAANANRLDFCDEVQRRLIAEATGIPR